MKVHMKWDFKALVLKKSGWVGDKFVMSSVSSMVGINKCKKFISWMRHLSSKVMFV